MVCSSSDFETIIRLSSNISCCVLSEDCLIYRIDQISLLVPLPLPRLVSYQLHASTFPGWHRWGFTLEEGVVTYSPIPPPQLTLFTTWAGLLHPQLGISSLDPQITYFCISPLESCSFMPHCIVLAFWKKRDRYRIPRYHYSAEIRQILQKLGTIFVSLGTLALIIYGLMPSHPCSYTFRAFWHCTGNLLSAPASQTYCWHFSLWTDKLETKLSLFLSFLHTYLYGGYSGLWLFIFQTSCLFPSLLILTGFIHTYMGTVHFFLPPVCCCLVSETKLCFSITV